MAQPASNPKIEELRFRLKTDPKSRIFYPLGEELRKVSAFTEAEQVLRTGLANHPTYLSAWVSLGRVLRELGNNQEASESLTRALQLDPGNVVAARILADAYLALGEKVEAIKKYKLVHALLPSDEELEGVIERLERELHPPAPAPVESIAIPEPAPEQPAAVEPPPVLDETPWAMEPEPPVMPSVVEALGRAEASQQPAAVEPPPVLDETPWAMEPEPPVMPSVVEAPGRAEASHPSPGSLDYARDDAETGDLVPMLATHEDSPFEEPAADLGYSADAFSIEQPEAMHIEPTPVSAELPAPEPEPADVFAPAAEPEPEESDDRIEIGLASDMPFPITAELPPPAADDFSKTITMADLYAKQGLVDEARDIYEDILARDPNNAPVRAKVEALDAAPPLQEATAEAASSSMKIARLEGWLAKMARRDIGGV
ncbi:MAG TPA: tetratricopeptide repeat protein [Thermoanaerobaculia bacterium]|nr:tetratricopeptide repeat protein [Thermoanaerobaculia bacterium]